MQLDIADYCWEITKHPGIKATHNNNKGSLFTIKTINSIQIISFYLFFSHSLKNKTLQEVLFKT